MKSSHNFECYFHNLKDSEYFKITRHLFDIEWENFYSENLLSFKDSEQENFKLPALDPNVETFLVLSFLFKLVQFIKIFLKNDFADCKNRVKSWFLFFITYPFITFLILFLHWLPVGVTIGT